MAEFSIDQTKKTLDALSPAEQKQILAWLRSLHPIHSLEARWGVPAEVVLEAISRASDLSQRGVLGLIAEAVFQKHIVEQLEGWSSAKVPPDAAYDFSLRRPDGTSARIQVKLQRRERGVPKQWRGSDEYFVVETQRTRSGRGAEGQSTRPYRFGEFDVLAVCMQPSTDDWTCFRFIPQASLLPRKGDPSCLEVLQPVALGPNEYWFKTLEECVDRIRVGSLSPMKLP